jgi:predicted AAA+ superfamily ATPase
MKKRLLKLPETESFFLFGARGVGKSTLMSNRYDNPALSIDLLNLRDEQKYLQDPQSLESEVLALPEGPSKIIIDEIQKIPALLNVVHSLIEKTNKQFIMTGSSARKLKHGAANLLAGRAFVRYLAPFSFLELEEEFDLDTALNFGLLPKIYKLKSHQDRTDFLRTYAHIYLKEEVWAEHLIRKLEPFHYFLEVAAQCNGDILNIKNIARDVAVNDNTISEYYSILEDTMLGFHLHAFKGSIRKKLLQKPKFYFFDVGVARALRRQLEIKVNAQSYEYGKLFEHFIIVEIIKLMQIYFPDYRVSYIRTQSSLEIDLVVERPGLKTLFIEIKSSASVRSDQLKHLQAMREEYGNKGEYICLSRLERPEKIDDVLVLPWQEGIKECFL